MSGTVGLDRDVASVVDSGSCSGCGACCLIDTGLQMGLDESGYLRPTRVSSPETIASATRAQVREFRATCPGRTVTSPRPVGARRDPIVGSYVAAWAAWATDPQFRHRGSSGGVLSALSAWLVEQGEVARVVGAAASPADPSRTVTVSITSRSEALLSAGSRYAPVGNAASAHALASDSAFLGKPCEASAVRALSGQRETGPGYVLSFFCAGTPSQLATDSLVHHIGVGPDERLTDLWYRGRGWPGSFTAVAPSGTYAASYDDSWGKHLGPTMQWRCKICPDGVGESSDITAADFWKVDERGYPVFTESAGRSALLARTPKGHQAVLRAISAGVIEVEPMDVADLVRTQPFQRTRRRMLAGRLTGSLLGGRRIPRYRGFGLLRLALSTPRRSLRSARGSRRRVRAGER